MTSKKSYAKSPLFAVFRTQLYSQRMLLILFGVVLALVPLAVGVISLNPSDVTYSYDYGGINHYIAAQRQLMTVCGLIPLLCFALALAVGEFGYLNQRRKLDFYHAIPVRRSDMFLGRALLASVSLVLGVLLVVLGQILIVNVQFVTISVGGGRLEQVYAAIWKNGVFMVFSVLAAYFFAVLVVVAAKSLWEAAFSLLLLSAAYPLSAMITIRIVQSSMMFYRLPPALWPCSAVRGRRCRFGCFPFCSCRRPCAAFSVFGRSAAGRASVRKAALRKAFAGPCASARRRPARLSEATVCCIFWMRTLPFCSAVCWARLRRGWLWNFYMHIRSAAF